MIQDSAGQSKTFIVLTAGSDGIPVGVHHFAIVSENPPNTMLNYPTASSCGTLICWRFNSYKSLSNRALGQLDLETTAPGFSINEKMMEARVPVLTEAQRRGTNRDDRPLNPNSIIFAFKLSSDATTR